VQEVSTRAQGLRLRGTLHLEVVIGLGLSEDGVTLGNFGYSLDSSHGIIDDQCNRERQLGGPSTHRTGEKLAEWIDGRAMEQLRLHPFLCHRYATRKAGRGHIILDSPTT
jgi:hypothetical protein